MSRLATVALVMLMLAPSGHAELLTNGDFEQPLTVGWTKDTSNTAGDYSFERSDTLGQQTPGYAARTYKFLAEYASLSQTVDVSGVDLDFSFDGRLRMEGGSSTCWPTGAFVVSYLSAAGSELGSTMFILRNEFCDWVESDTLHFIDVNLPGQWVIYNLDIAQEIADNLPGVTAGDVGKVRVRLYSYVNGT